MFLKKLKKWKNPNITIFNKLTNFWKNEYIKVIYLGDYFKIQKYKINSS